MLLYFKFFSFAVCIDWSKLDSAEVISTLSAGTTVVDKNSNATGVIVSAPGVAVVKGEHALSRFCYKFNMYKLCLAGRSRRSQNVKNTS